MADKECAGTLGPYSNVFSTICCAGHPGGAAYAAALQAVPEFLFRSHARGDPTTSIAFIEALDVCLEGLLCALRLSHSTYTFASHAISAAQNGQIGGKSGGHSLLEARQAPSMPGWDIRPVLNICLRVCGIPHRVQSLSQPAASRLHSRDSQGPGVRVDPGTLAMQVSTEMSADIYSRLQSIDVIDAEGYCQWNKCDVPHSCW